MNSIQFNSIQFKLVYIAHHERRKRMDIGRYGGQII
jgi:hypothetical protein